MNEGSWEECKESGSVIECTPDSAKAKSLKSTAEERIKFLTRKKPEREDARFLFEGCYSSTIEIIHAYVLLKGFKVVNHICLGYYLRDIMKRNDLFRIFNECRVRRNSLVYYGKNMSYNMAGKSIDNLIFLMKEISMIIDNMLK